MKTGIILALVLALGALVSFAQGQPGSPGGRPGGPGGRGGMRGGGRPPMPIVAALDVNTNGVVEAAELANASKALLKLDKDGDGIVNATELQPQRPAGNQQQQFTPPDGGKRPSPPIVITIDADGDGTLSTSEIANAATALKALDTDGDGQLNREELMPRPPGGSGGQGGQGSPGGPSGFGGGYPPPGQ